MSQHTPEGAALLRRFGIGPIELHSIARRMPGPGNKNDIDKARLSAVASLRKLTPLLGSTPASIIVFNDIGDPPRIPAKHRVILEAGPKGKHQWWAVSLSRNGWQTKRPANDYRESRFMVFLTPLGDSDETSFVQLVGIDESKLIVDEPPNATGAVMEFSNRPPAAGGMSDAQVEALLRNRGKNPELMPRSR